MNDAKSKRVFYVIAFLASIIGAFVVSSIAHTKYIEAIVFTIATIVFAIYRIAERSRQDILALPLTKATVTSCDVHFYEEGEYFFSEDLEKDTKDSLDPEVKLVPKKDFDLSSVDPESFYYEVSVSLTYQGKQIGSTYEGKTPVAVGSTMQVAYDEVHQSVYTMDDLEQMDDAKHRRKMTLLIVCLYLLSASILLVSLWYKKAASDVQDRFIAILGGGAFVFVGGFLFHLRKNEKEKKERIKDTLLAALFALIGIFVIIAVLLG